MPITLNTDKHKELDFESIDYVLEASRAEWSGTYSMFQKHSPHTRIEDMGQGFGTTVAKDENNRPVFLSCYFYSINGKKVLVIEPTSGLIDWDAIYQWFIEVQGWPKDQVNHCNGNWTNANNDHHLLQYCIK